MTEKLPPDRKVIASDAVLWLQQNPASEQMSVITSLPDFSEMSNVNFNDWRQWFVTTAALIIEWVNEKNVAIFYQSDIKHQGAWVDKGYLIMKAAEVQGAHIVWHKIVCRKPVGTIAMGRPSYSHMICISKSALANCNRPGPDVLPEVGHMSWSRAMGEKACQVACRFVRDATTSSVIVDPFCGRGTSLAVANEFGFDAIGVDISPRRCRQSMAYSTKPEE